MKYRDEYYYGGLALVAAVMLALVGSGSDDSTDFSATDSLQTSITDAAMAADDETAAVVSDKE